MSETTPNKKSDTDEIDLLDLFRRMGRTLRRWANSLGRAFLISVVFLLKRWLPLGLSLVAAIGLSYLIKSTSESFYTSDLVMRNNTISNTDMMLYINGLHKFCVDNNKPALAEALSVKPDIVLSVGDISAYWVIEDRKKGIAGMVDYNLRSNSYDTLTVRMKDRLDIRVKISSPQELSLLQTGIISYIKKDSLFQQRNRVRIRQNKELLTRLNYDIVQLDSLQKVKYFEETRSHKPQNGGQMIFLQEEKTQLIYTDIYVLYARKQALEAERDLYPDIVTVLTDFNLPAKPDNGTIYYGKKIIPLFLVITLILLIFLANRKKLDEVYKKY